MSRIKISEKDFIKLVSTRVGNIVYCPLDDVIERIKNAKKLWAVSILCMVHKAILEPWQPHHSSPDNDIVYEVELEYNG